jgi:hypothetical protein
MKDFAEKDEERIAGRMRMVAQRLEFTDGLEEQKLIQFPRRARERQEARDEYDQRTRDQPAVSAGETKVDGLAP